MSITFHLGDDLEQQLARDLGDLNEAAREALLIEAYRRGKLSIGGLACALGISVLEADAWLGRRGVPLNYDIEDFEADVQTLRELRANHNP